MKKEIVTFGCRLNGYESEVMRSHIDGVDSESDVIVFNTCAVTKEAERQARQAIRKAKRENPLVKIVVTGCSAQIDPKRYADMDEVSVVLGNEEKLDENIIKNAISLDNEEKIIVNDIMSVKETASHMVASFDGRARAFVQVQNGCNHRCTFCIIPYGRGNSRSIAIGEIVSQLRLLVNQGYNEVVLTGVDISSYGEDLPGNPSLGQMIKRVLALVPGLPRLRLSSIDVAEFDDDLFDLIENEKRFMPHLHISLQAGDDMILKRMKRRHSRQDVIDFCNRVRKLRPGIAFGADIIAGFPTETDEMFENSLNLISEADLQYLHVFPYSEREGTPAAKMPEVAKNIRKERAEKLRKSGEKQLDAFLINKVGNSMQAVVEKEDFARGEDFSPIRLQNPTKRIGEIISVNIIGYDNRELVGSESI